MIPVLKLRCVGAFCDSKWKAASKTVTAYKPTKPIVSKMAYRLTPAFAYSNNVCVNFKYVLYYHFRIFEIVS